jgi:hypothetical protein
MHVYFGVTAFAFIRKRFRSCRAALLVSHCAWERVALARAVLAVAEKPAGRFMIRSRIVGIPRATGESNATAREALGRVSRVGLVAPGRPQAHQYDPGAAVLCEVRCERNR